MVLREKLGRERHGIEIHPESERKLWLGEWSWDGRWLIMGTRFLWRI